VASLRVPEISVAQILAAVLIFLALLTRLARFVAHPDTLWYEARAVAESAKSITWRYAVGGQPFELGRDTVVIDTLLFQRLRETLTDVSHISRLVTFTDQGQITDAMRALRGQPIAIRQEAYRAGRIKDQARWYDRKQR